jgi:hypothetical protein
MQYVSPCKMIYSGKENTTIPGSLWNALWKLYWLTINKLKLKLKLNHNTTCYWFPDIYEMLYGSYIGWQ